jgi:hypothetical protein
MGLLDFRVDLTNDTEEGIERGARADVGWYYAKLKDAFEDEASNKLVLKFQIVGGPFDGSHESYYLADPEYADASKRDEAARRVKMIAGRIGVITEADFGKNYAEQEAPRTWLDFLGEPYFIHVEESKQTEEQKRTGKDPYRGIGYSGIYPLNYFGTETQPAADARGKPVKLPKDWPAELNVYRKPPRAGREWKDAVGAMAKSSGSETKADEFEKKVSAGPAPAADPYADL